MDEETLFHERTRGPVREISFQLSKDKFKYAF